jgi:hypothetical protein
MICLVRYIVGDLKGGLAMLDSQLADKLEKQGKVEILKTYDKEPKRLTKEALNDTNRRIQAIS